MAENSTAGLVAYFGALEDSRVERTKRHKLYMRAIDNYPGCLGETGWKLRGWVKVAPKVSLVSTTPTCSRPLDSGAFGYRITRQVILTLPRADS